MSEMVMVITEGEGRSLSHGHRLLSPLPAERVMDGGKHGGFYLFYWQNTKQRWTWTGDSMSRWSNQAVTCLLQRTTRWTTNNLSSSCQTWNNTGVAVDQPELERHGILQLHREKSVWRWCSVGMGAGLHLSLYFYLYLSLYHNESKPWIICEMILFQVVNSMPTPSYLTTTYMAGGVRIIIFS